MRTIMLVLTEYCNLACKYCYENKKKSNMSVDDARYIIDCEMHDYPDETFKIFFFGGEPFSAFANLAEIYDYVERDYRDRVLTYSVTTNGTLVHGKIQSWLKKHRDRVEVVLSLDGTQDMNDLNRVTKQGEGAFGLIDLDFFVNTWSKCIAKMTIAIDTLPEFAKGIQFIEEKGFLCKANFASGVNFEIEKNRRIILANFLDLIKYYTDNTHSLCYMLDLPLKQVLIPLNDKFRYCEAGSYRHCYPAEGREWYPCQGLMPMSTGEGVRLFSEVTFETTSVLKDSLCSKCPLVRICKTCYAMNYCSTGDVYKPDEQICYLNRLCMITSARIQYNRMKKTGNSDPQLLGAISIIAKELNSMFPCGDI